MAFQTHTLPSQIIAIVEVGSYRIKVCICEFKNDKVHILWYGEKRQSTSYFINGECRNLELLGTSIRDAISKTEKDNHIHVDKVVINYPFGELYFHHHKLSYKRDNESQLITKVELEKILKKTEKIVLEKCFKSIEKKSGFMETDMRLIISSILSFKIDKVPYERIIAESWRDIVVSLLNMFIPIDKSNHIKYIGGIIQKDITKIIPTEFSLRTIFKQKNIVIINIWAIYTSITIKSEWNIIGISKIPIWVNDLVGMVESEYSHTRSDILRSVGTGIYTDKEQDFLDIWKQWLMVWISEILDDEVCPKNFYVLSDIETDFIEKSISLIDFPSHEVKLVKKRNFVEINEKLINSRIENLDDFEISIEIAAMILELKNIIKKEKSLLVKTLKKAVLELGYSE